MKNSKRMRTRINLDVAVKGAHIKYIGGAMPYIWIGNQNCFGVVPDDELDTLAQMVAKIKSRKP